MATLWGTLEQLGFTKERIEECLRAVKTLELEDTLEWVRAQWELLTIISRYTDSSPTPQLFLHCDASELNCEGPIAAPLPLEESISAPPTPRPETASFGPPATPSRQLSFQSASHASPRDEAAVEASLRARILAYDDEVQKEVSMEENGDANSMYAGIKLQMSEIQRAQGVARRAAKGRGAKATVVSAEQEEWREMQVEVLKKKLKAIEGEYTFRKVDAGELGCIVRARNWLRC